MLDLAARVQDLLQFKYNSFIPDGYGGGIYKWVSKKTSKERYGHITPATMQLLKDAAQ